MLLILTSLLIISTRADLIVELSNGKLKGKRLTDLDDKPFYSFLSVPYAKPPLRDLRFKDPVPVETWDGIKDATTDMPSCFQRQWNGTFEGQEDCLYLNVHTPEISSEILKPVMVFIHGGGFKEGSGRYDMYGPEFLITQGIVLVTINYRLGVFGFMNFHNPRVGVSGNAALKDQTMALKWVHQNIEKFGGDPSQVTIFGESAGGASVHLHLLSPLSRGLFQRAISMSGTALNVWCNGMTNNGPIFAKRLGFEGNDEIEMVHFMQSANITDYMTLLANRTVMGPMYDSNLFGPIIEIPHNRAFLSASPRHLIKTGLFQKVPFMLGMTNADGMSVDVVYFVRFGKYDTLSADRYIPFYLKLNESQRAEVLAEFNQFYFKSKKPTVEDAIDLQSDGYFTYGLYETLFGHAKQQQDLYLYMFSSDTKLNFFKRLHPVTAGYKGACHMDDLGHLFKNTFTPVIEKDSIEDKAIRLTVKLFTNFAKYGKPVPKEEESDFGIEWNQMDDDRFNYVNIENDRLKAGNRLFENRAKFWCKTFKKYAPNEDVFCQWN